MEELASELALADVVITSTGADHFVITEELMRSVVKARKQRPVFFIDIAVPRNVDPRIGTLSNVFVYDVDDLQSVAADNLAVRQREANMAERIVHTEVELFDAWRRSLQLKPTVIALRRRVRGVVESELERTLPKLGGLQDSDRKALTRMVNALVNKLTHEPITCIRDQSGTPEGVLLLDAARKLYQLEDSVEDTGAPSGPSGPSPSAPPKEPTT